MTGLAIALALASGCLPVDGDRILASDLAKAVPQASALPSDMVLSYAPLPGVQRVFTPAEITQILTRHNIEAASPARVCFEWPVQPLSAEDVTTAMLASLDHPAAQLKVLEVSQHSVPAGKLSFPLRGLVRGAALAKSVLWKGHIEYAPGRRLPVWGRVHLTVPVDRVITTRTIPAGERIEQADVRMETELTLPDTRPGVPTKLDDIIGQNARRTIQAGSTISAADVVKAPAVARGDVIRVDVHAGRAHISFEGVAQASAGIGEFIPVKNMETRKVMRARVASRGNAVVNLDR